MSLIQPAAKVVNRQELLDRYPRSRNGRLIFTNGCFDLIHAGHVEYLHAARALGDVLVVGLNADASVRRLKGPGRPLVGERDRAYLLAGLGCVDAVTVFDEDTPRELVAALLPDILVKGGDYRVDQVVGREETEAAGGEVRIVPLREGFSTTALLQKIRRLPQ